MSFWNVLEAKLIRAMNDTTFPIDFTQEERERFERLKKDTDNWRERGFIYKMLHPGEHYVVRSAIMEMQVIIINAYERKIATDKKV
jgi:hypothetical protein